jgi:Raf kinase inhibitor-like YbhB/YbcL family protein
MQLGGGIMGRWIVLLLLLMPLAGLFPALAAGKGMTKMENLTVTSPAFSTGAAIPAKYTCDGEDVSPPLIFGAVPAGTRSLTLIMDDPDAPVGTWVHWVVWNIPAQTREIPENSLPAGAAQGKNDWKHTDYGGPCPPSRTHHYFFKLYALDTVLNLGASTTKADLERAIQGHILARGELMGTYRKR